VSKELAAAYRALQAKAPGGEKAAAFGSLYGVRGSSDGHQVFLKTRHRTHPSEIIVAQDGSLIVKPLTDDIGTMSIGYDGSDTVQGLLIGDDGLWRLAPDKFADLRNAAQPTSRPSLVITAERWSDLSNPVTLARINPEMVNRALSYARAPTP
jgi:hypothetical protein